MVEAGVCVLEFSIPSSVLVLLRQDMSQSIYYSHRLLIPVVVSKADYDITNRLHKVRTQVSTMLYGPLNDILQINFIGRHMPAEGWIGKHRR